MNKWCRIEHLKHYGRPEESSMDLRQGLAVFVRWLHGVGASRDGKPDIEDGHVTDRSRLVLLPVLLLRVLRHRALCRSKLQVRRLVRIRPIPVAATFATFDGSTEGTLTTRI
jgi:hypothetical protein